jgi:hypothetical protein
MATRGQEMSQTITDEYGEVYAIIHRKEDWNRGLDFITPDDAFLQAGTFWYQKGKRCKPHRHIHNPRPNCFTQECNIVLSGSIQVTIYDTCDEEICQTVLKAGDLIVVLTGGHGYEILEDDTRIVECKNGPFISIEKDKKLLCLTK